MQRKKGYQMVPDMHTKFLKFFEKIDIKVWEICKFRVQNGGILDGNWKKLKRYPRIRRIAEHILATAQNLIFAIVIRSVFIVCSPIVCFYNCPTGSAP